MNARRSFSGSGCRSQLPCFIEPLEARQLLSAVHHVVHAPKSHAPAPHPAVHAAKSPAPARHVAHAVKAPAPAKQKSARAVKASAAHKSAPAVQAAAATTSTTASPPVTVLNSIYPDCLGTWTGTATAVTTTTVYHFTVVFTRQIGVSLTGTFSLGSLVGGNVLTTATIGLSPSFMVQVQGPTATASFVGAVAANGQYINGRWSVLSNQGAWLVGTFTMTQ